MTFFYHPDTGLLWLPPYLYPWACQVSHGPGHVTTAGILGGVQKCFYAPNFQKAAHDHVRKCLI